MTTTLVAVSATAGAAASAPGGLGGCLASFCSRPALSFLNSAPSSDAEPTAGAAGNGGLDGLAPAHQGDPEEQELYDFLCGVLGRTARQECRRRAEVRAERGSRSSTGSAWEAPPFPPCRCRPPAGPTPDPEPERGRRAGRVRGGQGPGQGRAGGERGGGPGGTAAGAEPGLSRWPRRRCRAPGPGCSGAGAECAAGRPDMEVVDETEALQRFFEGEGPRGAGGDDDPLALGAPNPVCLGTGTSDCAFARPGPRQNACSGRGPLLGSEPGTREPKMEMFTELTWDQKKSASRIENNHES